VAAAARKAKKGRFPRSNRATRLNSLEKLRRNHVKLVGLIHDLVRFRKEEK
jgi:hypothetical protein